ncbi:hypothetical protein TELCIR_19736 [Teladorsagia circumcincta]|uniref:Uncharacterized protein n=1 Tax=Teladorsagia circumcincta TaxID=45464 RepID=A0A2G9TLE4_TELCI|nr:hypothetical protein TELCIR_19736 [Teladorsagia circumcincta]
MVTEDKDMYTWLRHRKKRASWRSKHQILSMIEEMSIGGDYRPGSVHSKWKADEDDLDMPTSQKHPHFVYRKY